MAKLLRLNENLVDLINLKQSLIVSRLTYKVYRLTRDMYDDDT